MNLKKISLIFTLAAATLFSGCSNSQYMANGKPRYGTKAYDRNVKSDTNQRKKEMFKDGGCDQNIYRNSGRHDNGNPNRKVKKIKR